MEVNIYDHDSTLLVTNTNSILFPNTKAVSTS